AKDPEDRYQTIKDVAIELKDVRRELQAAAGIDTIVPPSRDIVAATQTISESDPSRVAASSTGLSPTPSTHPSSAEYIVNGIKQHRLVAAMVVGVLIVVVTALAIGLYKFSTGAKKSAASLPAPKLQRLTTSGRASDAAIS